MPESNRDEIVKLEALYATNPAGRVFTHLAEAYRKAGEYDRARAILEKGLEKHPTYASAHVVLGRVLMDLNKSDEAVESFRKVLQLDPHNLVALRSLGDLARAAGRNAEAMGYFEELRHQDPSNEEISGVIAELLAAPDFHAAEPPEPLPELLEPERTHTTEAVRETSAPEAQLEEMMAEAVEPDWTAGEGEAETLPGDLADFARRTASAEDYGTVDLEETRAEVSEPPAVQEPQALAPSAPEPEPEEPRFAAAEEEFAPAFADFAPPIPERPVEEAVATEPPATEPPAEEAVFAELPVAEEPLADIPPSEIPVDLGPSDLEIEVPPEETFQSIDFSEFGAESEEPAFEERVTPETTLEPTAPEAQPAVESDVPFEPTLELPEETPIVFEPAGEVFETSPESFEPAPIETSEAPPAFETERPPAAQPGAEVLTETMAELYRSQGLNDRAAEVYRALLKERPGDTHLQSKLREVEAEMMHVAPEIEANHETPLEIHEPAAEMPTSPTDEEIESPWTSFNQAAATTPSPYAWKEDIQSDDDAGRPVSEYFQTLLSWRPANPVQSSFTEVIREATGETEPFDLSEPMGTAEEPLFQEPVSEAESSPSPMGASQQMPWDEPGLPGSSAQEANRDDFDDWFAEEPPPEATEQQQPAAPSPPPSMAAETGDSDEEDDDLEMFRSWLQSLKK